MDSTTHVKVTLITIAKGAYRQFELSIVHRRTRQCWRVYSLAVGLLLGSVPELRASGCADRFELNEIDAKFFLETEAFERQLETRGKRTR